MERQTTLRSAKMCKVLAAILCAGACLFLFVPLRAEAHAQYDHSDPASNARLPGGHSPLRVQVWFTEEVEPAFSWLQVYNQARNRVDVNDSHVAPGDLSSLLVSLRPRLPDGAYSVVFHTVSAEDAHEITGSFSFVVGGGALPTDTGAWLSQLQGSSTQSDLNVWSVTTRWLNYLGMAGLVGGLLFLLLVWRPGMYALDGLLKPQFRAARRALEERAVFYLLAALLLLLAGWGLFLGYQAWTMGGVLPWQAGGSDVLKRLLFASRFGMIWLCRLGLIVLSLLLWLLARKRRTAKKGFVPIIAWIMLLLGVGIMLTDVLNSHAAAGELIWLLLPANLLHLVGAGFWIGGLFALLFLLPAALLHLTPGTGDRTRLLARIIPHFTRVALLSVGLVGLTGIVQAFFLVKTPSALVESGYGQALLVKSALFALLLLLGAFNGFRVSPAMQRFASCSDEQLGAASFAAGSLQRTFRRVVTMETVLAICLLLAVGVLTSLAPPLTQSHAEARQQGPLLYQGQAHDLTYRLVINPGTVGPNTVEVVLTGKEGRPIQSTSVVLLRCMMLDMDMGVQDVSLAPVNTEPGYYQATTSALSMSGRWRMALIVRRTGFNDVEVAWEETLQ
jgi:copper transport protein